VIAAALTDAHARYVSWRGGIIMIQAFSDVGILVRANAEFRQFPPGHTRPHILRQPKISSLTEGVFIRIETLPRMWARGAAQPWQFCFHANNRSRNARHRRFISADGNESLRRITESAVTASLASFYL
jgi:hypothetical protein